MEAHWQEAYRTLLNAARDCHSAFLGTAGSWTQGDLYPDLKRGEVVVGLTGGLGRQAYGLADVRDAGEGRSLVEAKGADVPADYAGALLEWAKGEPCRGWPANGKRR